MNNNMEEVQSTGSMSNDDEDSVNDGGKDDHSTTTGEDGNAVESLNERAQAEQEIEGLAKSTTAKIQCARWVVFALIVVTGAVLSYFTWYILDSAQDSSYEEGVSLYHDRCILL
jgi:hypothetical protein